MSVIQKSMAACTSATTLREAMNACARMAMSWRRMAETALVRDLHAVSMM